MQGIIQLIVRLYVTTKKSRQIPVVSGKNTVESLYEDIVRRGFKSVFIAAGKTIRNQGMLDTLVESLNSSGISTVFFSDIVPNPTIENVEKGLRVYRENNCGCVIAAGGGSVLDCAKSIALRANNPRVSVKMMSLYVVPCRKSAPIYAVPTTSGTGSEITFFSVITNAKNRQKLAIISDKYLPEKIVFDSELLKRVPRNPTIYAGLDALCHSIEAYISTNSRYFPEDVVSAPEVCRDIFEYLPAAANEQENEQARLKMAAASYNAGINIRHAGVGFIHAIAHRLGETYDIPHGLACAAVMPHVLKATLRKAGGKLCELAEKSGVADSAEEFIERIIELEKALGIPEKFGAISEKDYPHMIRRIFSEAATQGCPQKLSRTEVLGILNKLKAD